MKVNIVDMMLMDGTLSRDSVDKLVSHEPPMRITLGNILRENILDDNRVKSYLVKQFVKGKLSLTNIDDIEEIDSEKIYEMISDSTGISYVNLNDQHIDSEMSTIIPYKYMHEYKVIPIEKSNSELKVSFMNPLDTKALDAIQKLLPRLVVKVAFSAPMQIENKLEEIRLSLEIRKLIDEIRVDLNSEYGGKEADSSSAIFKLIEIVLGDAVTSRASDVHIEAVSNGCRIRSRVDGRLVESFLFDADIFAPLVSRVKLLANMDIAERRKPQDGRFDMTLENREFDFRVSSLPTIFGESIAIRVLDKLKMMISLSDIGMDAKSYDIFKRVISNPYGLVLITGPTGSGKTTTLYGAINSIKSIAEKIITVEDPVEYQLDGIQQVQVQEKSGLGFANSLRSILRQDPDKIMIGEIRDKETLRIAIQASLTGHLVLSTLHTNDAISAIDRIVDMGIERYLLSGALMAVQAQRLVRKICPSCKKKSNTSLESLNGIISRVPDEYQLFVGSGCRRCKNTGYLGREMISEVLVISDKISSMIANGFTKEKILKQALKEGFVPLLEDGIQKALIGTTSIEEVLRVARL